ncbi:MAG TPA: hypothetical protein VN720_09915 [Rudaea sp.]|nr:hypothetical protein [Rudaea sp.]
MSDLSQRQAVAAPRAPRPEHELEYPDRSNLPQNPAAPATSQYPLDAAGRRTLSPSLDIHTTSLSFNGPTLSDTGAFPPDSMGTAGPTQFIVFVNGRIRSYTRAGVADGVINADPDVFFASVMTPIGGSVVLNFTSDPQIRYDRFSGRWFMSIIDVPCTNGTCTATAANRWLLAVSDAASNGVISASTVWTFFKFQADPGTNFCDYPSLGIDVNALYVGCNMFTSAGAFVGTNGYVIQKASTLTVGPIVVTSFANLAAGAGAGPESPRGVDNFDASATEGYFVGPDNATFSTIMFRRVSNPGSLTPTISANIPVTVPTTTTPNTVEHAGNTGGNNGKLDSIDDRFFQAMIRNGHLWTAHNFRVSSAGVASIATESRNAVRWYEFQNLAGTPTVVESGTVYDSAATRAAARQYWIPSIAATGQGHAVLGFTLAGTPSGATPAYVGRLAGDAAGTMSGPPTAGAVQVGTTAASYNPPGDPGGAGGRRWGDYSFTVVDPLDDMTVWTIQEYNQATNSYAVRVAKLLAPPPATPTCAGAPIAFNGPTGDVVINATSSNGSGFYDPGANLPVPALPFKHIAATVTNAVVNSATYDSPTKVTLNITASAAGLQDVTITNPDGQSVTAAGCIDVSLPGAAATVSFTTQPATAGNVVAGATIPLVAHVVDSIGNPVSGQSVTLAIGNNAGSSTLSVTTNPIVTNASGDATFAGVSLNKIGSGYTLKATDTTTPSATVATSHAFNIIAGAAASVTFTTQPASSSNIVAGANIPLTAHVQDTNANPVSGDNVTLAFNNNAGSSTLSVTANPVATNASGDAVFAGVSLNKVGTNYSLKATDSSASPLSVTGNAFNIIAGAAASISFATPPTDAVAGVAIAPAIVANVQDALGNVVAAQSVSLAIVNNAGATGILSGGTAQPSDALGDSTFNGASIDKAGVGYTLSANVGALTTTSDPFTISPNVAAQLEFVTEPANLAAGTTTSAAVSVEDAFGNVKDSDDTTQISISVDACGTRVLGTRTVSAGTAQFPDLRFRTITDPATLQLHALSDTALSGDSATFKVLANPDALFWGGFEGCDP